MTLSGKGPKCRVCTHPDRVQIESLLARGAGIAAVKPTMGDAFSRRALYRHRAEHMTASGLSAVRPVPFPYSGSPLKRLKWLQRETEHTAALAELQGNISLKLKALHELGRFIWLEERLNRGQQEPVDITTEAAYAEHLRRLEEAHERRRAALAPPDPEPASAGIARGRREPLASVPVEQPILSTKRHQRPRGERVTFAMLNQ